MQQVWIALSPPDRRPSTAEYRSALACVHSLRAVIAPAYFL
jgi:hypothetical protein